MLGDLIVYKIQCGKNFTARIDFNKMFLFWKYNDEWSEFEYSQLMELREMIYSLGRLFWRLFVFRKICIFSDYEYLDKVKSNFWVRIFTLDDGIYLERMKKFPSK
jgi:hypothetical protein